MTSTVQAAALSAADVWPLPGRGEFDGDAAAHRAWYRDNIVALVRRLDLNNLVIAAAAEVTNRTISDWFIAETGIAPQPYRKMHGLTKRTHISTGPTSRQLAAVTRLSGLTPCWDGTPADVIVDLRAAADILRHPAVTVLATAPSQNRKVRHQVVHAPHCPGTDPAVPIEGDWVIDGYGLGANTEYGTSVLLATYPGAEPFRFAILTGTRGHGTFAMSWAKEVLAPIAAAFERTGATSTKAETRDRYHDAQRSAHATLEAVADTLAQVLADPEQWTSGYGATDLARMVPGWETNGTETAWPGSVENLTLLLGWASTGATRAETIGFCVRQGWDWSDLHAYRDMFGMSDLDRFAQVLDNLDQGWDGAPVHYQAALFDEATRGH